MTRHELGRNVVFGAGACGGKWVMAKVRGGVWMVVVLEISQHDRTEDYHRLEIDIDYGACALDSTYSALNI